MTKKNLQFSVIEEKKRSVFRFESHKSTVSNFMFYLKVGDAIVMFESHVPQHSNQGLMNSMG